MADEFRLDPELHGTVKGVRESVRLLFEQLRLRNEDGDVSGKKRLDRIPALAKNNFSNLTGSNRHLAAVEAWRLVAFIEGDKQAQLSPLAREALRVVELDKKLAALRASESWREAASRLRQALGVEPQPEEASQASAPDRKSSLDGAALPTSEAIGGDIPEGPRVPPVPSGRRHRWRRAALIALPALTAVGVAAATDWFATPGPSPRSCVALETASHELLARHWSLRSRGVALPRPRRTEAKPQIVVISDSPGRDVQSIWTTSQFSYAEGDAPSRPGGGKSDYRLRVGGWGDTYLSLLRVPVISDRLAHKAVIQLTVMGDEPSSRPTSMTLRAIGDRWRVGPGPDSRLWWRDCPGSDAIVNHLPAPGPRGSAYEIDITDLYNHWVDGVRTQYGIILEPEHIGSWGPDRPSYPNLSNFYSTRARDLGNRPRLVLTY